MVDPHEPRWKEFITTIQSDTDVSAVMVNGISRTIHFDAHKMKNSVFSNTSSTWTTLASVSLIVDQESCSTTPLPDPVEFHRKSARIRDIDDNVDQ